MNPVLSLFYPVVIFCAGVVAGNVNYVLWTPFHRGIVRKELVLEVPELPEVPGGKKSKRGVTSRQQTPTIPFKGPHRGLRSNDPKVNAPSRPG